jgi:hypothetical protein
VFKCQIEWFHAALQELFPPEAAGGAAFGSISWRAECIALAPALLPLSGNGNRETTYIYTTRAAAAAACAAAGFAKGLCTQADLVGHSRCAAGWTSDWAGFWMAASSEGCGRRGYNPWSGPAGAYCCGPAEAGTDARELKSREAEQNVEFTGASWLY